MINKAFIFDMDGVLINSETAWIPYQRNFSINLFGKEIYKKIGSTMGITVDTIYKNAASHGFTMGLNKYYEIYDRQAKLIYKAAEPTKDINRLINFLKRKQFKLGLVSSSRGVWISMVLTKLNMQNMFDFCLSLNDEKHIKPKPYPDGYLTAMRNLNVIPQDTIILEDSNAGIASAKCSGAYTIAYREHLLSNFVQKEAEAYANNVYDVIRNVENIRR